MPEKRALKKTVRISILTLGVVLVTAFFQNCGGQQVFVAREAYIPVTKLENELVTIYGERLSPAMCADSSHYVCQHKIFNTEIDNAEAVAHYDCVTINGESICPHGKTFTYNSAAAKAACKEGCNENYNYEEFACYYNLPTVDGIHPLQSSGADLAETLAAVHAACVRVSALAQGGE